jgi:hypothetical protein
MTEPGATHDVGRAVALVLLVLSTVILVAVLREGSISEEEAAAADVAATKGDWPGTIAHARASAEAYVPGSPWPERSLRRLAAVGHDAEARGDEGTALLAYGAMRTAVVATRSPGGRGRAHWRAEAEEGLARVAAAHQEVMRPRDAPPAAIDFHGEDVPTDTSLAILAVAALTTLGGLGRLVLGAPGRGARIAQVVALAGFVAFAAVLLTN